MPVLCEKVQPFHTSYTRRSAEAQAHLRALYARTDSAKQGHQPGHNPRQVVQHHALLSPAYNTYRYSHLYRGRRCRATRWDGDFRHACAPRPYKCIAQWHSLERLQHILEPKHQYVCPNPVIEHITRRGLIAWSSAKPSPRASKAPTGQSSTSTSAE